MNLMKGASEGDEKIAEERLKLEDRLLSLRSKQQELLSKGTPEALEASKKLETNVGNIERQMMALADASRQVRAEFIAMAAISAGVKDSAQISERLKALDDEVAAEQRLNAARHQGVAAMASAAVETKLQPQVDKLNEMRETLVLMASTPGISGDAMNAYAAGLNAADANIQRMRADLKKLQTDDPGFFDKQRESLDKYRMEFGTLKEGMAGFADSLMKSKAQLQSSFFGALTAGFNGLNDSIAKVLVTGKGGFKAVLESLAESLIKLGLQAVETAVMMKLLPQAFAAASAGGAAVQIAADNAARQAAIGAAAATAAISAAWGGPAAAAAAAAITMGALEGITAVGALAGGGDVLPGRAYVVGEKRPELFVPNSAGHVYPSVGQGGAGPNVHIQTSINTVDAAGFDSLLEKHASVVARHVRRQLRLAGARA